MALTIDVRGIEALGARLRAIGDDAPKAVVRAMRRTRTTVMTQVARVVSRASGLPVRRAKRSIHGTSPNLQSPDSTITLWGGRAPLVDYARGVSGQFRPPSAFRAKMPQGHVGWFERRPGQASLRHDQPGRAKSTRIRPGVWHTLPIDEAYGPEFTHFLSGAALADILRLGGEAFQKNLEHEIEFREGQQAGAA